MSSAGHLERGKDMFVWWLLFSHFVTLLEQQSCSDKAQMRYLNSSQAGIRSRLHQTFLSFCQLFAEFFINDNQKNWILKTIISNLSCSCVSVQLKELHVRSLDGTHVSCQHSRKDLEKRVSLGYRVSPADLPCPSDDPSSSAGKRKASNLSSTSHSSCCFRFTPLALCAPFPIMQRACTMSCIFLQNIFLREPLSFPFFQMCQSLFFLNATRPREHFCSHAQTHTGAHTHTQHSYMMSSGEEKKGIHICTFPYLSTKEPSTLSLSKNRLLFFTSVWDWRGHRGGLHFMPLYGLYCFCSYR